MEMELRYYKTAAGRWPFVEWMEGLKDPRARAKIDVRLAELLPATSGMRIEDIERAKNCFKDYKAR